MLTTGHNQYLQPDYLSPLPLTVGNAFSSPNRFHVLLHPPILALLLSFVLSVLNTCVCVLVSRIANGVSQCA